MKMKMEVIDYKKIVGKIDDFADNLLDVVMDEAFRGAVSIQNFIKRSMETTKRAPWFYMRGGKRHYPSMPLSPPARDTGELISRLLADIRPEQKEVEVGVKAGAPYSVFLEEGTKKMMERPFLQPAVDVLAPKIEKDIMAAIITATRRG